MKIPENTRVPGGVVTILLFKAKSWAYQYVFQRIPHSIHQVVEIINGSVNLGSKLIFGPSVIANLRLKIYTPGMNDDGVILNILNAIVDTVITLSGWADTI